MKEFITRLKNPGTIISIVSAVILLLTAVGVKVNNEVVMNIVQIICSLGIAVGVLNNPTTPGVYVPGTSIAEQETTVTK